MVKNSLDPKKHIDLEGVNRYFKTKFSIRIKRDTNQTTSINKSLTMSV
jgi:hypothetical protein